MACDPASTVDPVDPRNSLKEVLVKLRWILSEKACLTFECGGLEDRADELLKFSYVLDKKDPTQFRDDLKVNDSKWPLYRLLHHFQRVPLKALGLRQF